MAACWSPPDRRLATSDDVIIVCSYQHLHHQRHGKTLGFFRKKVMFEPKYLEIQQKLGGLN